MAAAEEISVDDSVAAVQSEQDGIFTIKEEHENATKGFSCLV